MFDVERAVEAREQDQLPAGHEPATFVLRCPNGHEWRSEGTYHRASQATRPGRPACPRPGCGLGEWMCETFAGSDRPRADAT